jgi:hypothetical protein
MSSSPNIAQSSANASNILLHPDVVTVAQSCSNLVLTKKFYRDGTVLPYDMVKTFNFYEYEIYDLIDLSKVVMNCIDKPKLCLLRCRIKDQWRHQRRLYNEILIEQPMHWFALDIDGYKTSSGNIRKDAEAVLLGLGWQGVECFALASASYGIKPGIRMRMFFWANRPVDHIILKKFLMNNKVCADLALFFPIQPIYVAKPLFLDGMKDPVAPGGRHAWIDGDYSSVTIAERFSGDHGRYAERSYTKKQAKHYLTAAFEKICQAEIGSRHDILRDQSIFMGKLIAQEIIDKDEVVETIEYAISTWGEGVKKRDRDAMEYGFKKGEIAIEGENNNDF